MCANRSVEWVGDKVDSERTGLPLEIVRCRSCQLVFLSKQPEGFEAALYAYYKERMTWSRDELYSELTTQRYMDLIRGFEKRVSGRKAIDVGCGQGQFVEAMQRSGWNILGIDMSEPAIDVCCRFGLPARVLDVFSSELEPGSFDLVTMFEVIEHVSQPARFIRRAYELLRPGGVFYLTTPNFDCLDRRILGVEWSVIHSEHLIYFTPVTLAACASRVWPYGSKVQPRTRNVSAQALKQLFPRSSPAPDIDTETSSPVAASKSESQGNAEEALRHALESHWMLKLAKRGLNHLLDVQGLGNAMVLELRKF